MNAVNNVFSQPYILGRAIPEPDGSFKQKAYPMSKVTIEDTFYPDKNNPDKIVHHYKTFFDEKGNVIARSNNAKFISGVDAAGTTTFPEANLIYVQA